MHATDGLERRSKSLLLTLDEAGNELRVCSKTVRNWAEKGHFPLLKLEGATRVRRSDLEAYLERVARGTVDGGQA